MAMEKSGSFGSHLASQHADRMPQPHQETTRRTFLLQPLYYSLSLCFLCCPSAASRIIFACDRKRLGIRSWATCAYLPPHIRKRFRGRLWFASHGRFRHSQSNNSKVSERMLSPTPARQRLSQDSKGERPCLTRHPKYVRRVPVVE